MILTYCLSFLGCEVVSIIKKKNSKYYWNDTEISRSLNFATKELGLLSPILLKAFFLF